jgi:hypothetical protein
MMSVEAGAKLEENKNDESMEAPPLLILEDAEKFKDEDGNNVEIETRGERVPKGVFFLVSDVSKVFEMPNIKNTILKTDRDEYVKDEDFVVFARKGVDPVHPHTYKKRLFLTYGGMIKTLYMSRSKKAKTFRAWATNILFTVQMGAVEQKEVLGAKLIGQPVKAVRAVFKTFAKEVSCIYRFALGTAGELRETMNIPITVPDNFIITKFGQTGDLARRAGEHQKTYEKIPGVRVGLMDFVYVDPKYVFEAEKDIKNFFTTIEKALEFESFKELVATNPEHENIIRKQFRFIGAEYAGSLTALIVEIERLKTKLESVEREHKSEIDLLKKTHECEMLVKDNIIACGAKELQYKELELKYKDMQLNAMAGVPVGRVY